MSESLHTRFREFVILPPHGEQALTESGPRDRLGRDPKTESTQLRAARCRAFQNRGLVRIDQFDLCGKRPRELIASDPGAVLKAAEDHLTGAIHG